jgi:PadR family transcriptional regulator PadR
MTVQEQMRKGTTTVIILNLLAEFKEGLIYPRMHEMERQGLVRSEWKGKEGSRRRKFYTITDQGRRQREEELQSWQAFAENVNRLLGVEPVA